MSVGCPVIVFAKAPVPGSVKTRLAAGIGMEAAARLAERMLVEAVMRALAIVAALMNLRSRLTGIATGDQAMFMTRAAFRAVGGFPDQPLMEDIELSRRLRRLSAPACLRARVVTSGRRWEARGVWRTIALMWRLRLLYSLGVAPERLARSYR